MKITRHAEEIASVLSLSPNMRPSADAVGQIELTKGSECLVHTFQSFNIVIRCSRFKCVNAILRVVESQVCHTKVDADDRNYVKLVSEHQIEECVVTSS